MEKPWYIQEYKDKEYLHNITLIAKEFTAELPDHDHCELCWARFSTHPEDHNRGYFDENSNSWICPDCFQELAILFGWQVEF